MKKAVSMFLTAALAVSCLAGCGSSAGNTSTGNASAGADSSASDDSAADGSVFKIGSIGPTTGDAAIYGNAVMNAAQMAVDEMQLAVQTDISLHSKQRMIRTMQRNPSMHITH